jgi:hypothetical protein
LSENLNGNRHHAEDVGVVFGLHGDGVAGGKWHALVDVPHLKKMR